MDINYDEFDEVLDRMQKIVSELVYDNLIKTDELKPEKAYDALIYFSYKNEIEKSNYICSIFNEKQPDFLIGKIDELLIDENYELLKIFKNYKLI